MVGVDIKNLNKMAGFAALRPYFIEIFDIVAYHPNKSSLQSLQKTITKRKFLSSLTFVVEEAEF